MISVLNLGRCEYGSALRLQETLVDLRKQGRTPNTLLFVEHPSVITLGRNANESNIVAPRELLASRGVEVFEINRGGDVTFHGPGQLVAYPIFDLRSFTPKFGAIDFVRGLEEVLIRICAQYRIETQRIKGMTGVWTFPTVPPRIAVEQRGGMNRDYQPDGGPLESGAPSSPGAPGSQSEAELTWDSTQLGGPLKPPLPGWGSSQHQQDVSEKPGAPGSQSEAELTWDSTQPGGPLKPPSLGWGSSQHQQDVWDERKIAAIGVHISRGVTSHGFALNVTTDLDLFKLIVPCGLTKPVTSIEFETGDRPTLDEVATHASRFFGEVFHSQMLWLDSLDDLLASQESAASDPVDTPARAPENERRIAGDDTHLA